MTGIPAWLATFKVTGTWDDHRARGSAGGVDFGAPVGTDILAPSAGVLSFRYFPDRSSVIRVTRPDGTATEFLHGHLVGKARTVTAGEHIGESDGRKGADGAGPSTGPHIHVHDVDARGARVYPFSTIPDPPKEEARAMDTGYIFDGKRYAILDPMLENGYELTTDVKEAEGFSLRLGPARGPYRTRDAAQFDVALRQAAAARAQYLEDLGRVNVGPVTVEPDPRVPDLLIEVRDAVRALNPPDAR